MREIKLVNSKQDSREYWYLHRKESKLMLKLRNSAIIFKSTILIWTLTSMKANSRHLILFRVWQIKWQLNKWIDNLYKIIILMPLNLKSTYANRISKWVLIRILMNLNQRNSSHKLVAWNWSKLEWEIEQAVK